MFTKLFEPLQIGPLLLSHRVVMAPLTRMRADRNTRAPRPLNVEYYAQRATEGGLIIAEASQISEQGQGAPGTPGIHSDAQIVGWRAITDAVHAKGGRMYLQLWHMGRISHSSHQPGGALPVAPSAIAAQGQATTPDWQRVPFEVPRALETAEIAGLIETYAQAARNAMKAGFDGVEVHGANGYLLEQFLHNSSNCRGDRYGGPVENRSRLLLEVAEAVVGVCGGDRVSVRLSPFGIANSSGDDAPGPLYAYLLPALAALGVGMLHLIEPRASGSGQADVDHKGLPSASEMFRSVWPGVLIAAGNYQPDTAEAALKAGHADAIAFGRLFIANPDLPARLRLNAALNPYNRATFYGGETEGYTDYPALHPAPGVPTMA